MVNSEIGRILTDAVKWCSVNLKMDEIATSLRSESLYPGKEFWSHATPDFRKVDIVSQICEIRSALTDKQSAFPVSGRLLCFYPHFSLNDGCIGPASCGFIDMEDTPPWDTWLFYSLEDIEKRHTEERACLYSWVPEQLIELVELGMKEDCYECLVWGEKLERVLWQTEVS